MSPSWYLEANASESWENVKGKIHENELRFCLQFKEALIGSKEVIYIVMIIRLCYW